MATTSEETTTIDFARSAVDKGASPPLAELQSAAAVVNRHLPPTPQYCWPSLSSRLRCEAWVKHENYTPIGAFKLRGGIYYLSETRRTKDEITGLVAATRGNHGQSVAYAAKLFGFEVEIVVPHGNSAEKNTAMQSLGAKLIIHGHDFQAALEHAEDLATQRNRLLVPSFDPLLVKGVSSYALELFNGMPEPDLVYVAIGLGSGVCAVIAARDALGAKTRVVGVVSSEAPACALSLRQNRCVTRAPSTRICDGIACRAPDPRALAWMRQGLERVVEVSDDEVEEAMRIYFSDTHSVAEGAGAAPLAAALQEKELIRDKRVALVLSGGNVDTDTFARVLRSSNLQ